MLENTTFEPRVTMAGPAWEPPLLGEVIAGAIRKGIFFYSFEYSAARDPNPEVTLVTAVHPKKICIAPDQTLITACHWSTIKRFSANFQRSPTVCVSRVAVLLTCRAAFAYSQSNISASAIAKVGEVFLRPNRPPSRHLRLNVRHFEREQL